MTLSTKQSKLTKLAILASAIFMLACQEQVAQTSSTSSPSGDLENMPVSRTGNLEQNWQLENKSFTFKDGKYWGNTGCNDFSGGYTMITPTKVQIMPMVLTRKMCTDQKLMQDEANFAKAFPGGYDIMFQGGTAILLNDQRSWVFGQNVQ